MFHVTLLSSLTSKSFPSVGKPPVVMCYQSELPSYMPGN